MKNKSIEALLLDNKKHRNIAGRASSKYMHDLS
jgi:hypothetical protein